VKLSDDLGEVGPTGRTGIPAWRHSDVEGDGAARGLLQTSTGSHQLHDLLVSSAWVRRVTETQHFPHHNAERPAKQHTKFFISARCNTYIARLCYDVSVRLSVRLSVTEVHWRIIANLGFKFRSQFTAHCGRPACGCEGRDHRREEWMDHLALC